jgi:hypothetical protein
VSPVAVAAQLAGVAAMQAAAAAPLAVTVAMPQQVKANTRPAAVRLVPAVSAAAGSSVCVSAFGLLCKKEADKCDIRLRVASCVCMKETEGLARTVATSRVEYHLLRACCGC